MFQFKFFQLKDIEFSNLTFFSEVLFIRKKILTVLEYLAAQDKSYNYNREIVIFPSYKNP